MSLEHLRKIREYEMEKILPDINACLPKGSRILEIGAGAGWQTWKLNQCGFVAEAIDVENSDYAGDCVCPVKNYDGEIIPFPDNYFDAVFSSNVFEHIPHLVRFQEEIKRVLKEDGTAFHILPSGSWRYWSNITHYIFVMQTVFKKLLSIARPPSPPEESQSPGDGLPQGDTRRTGKVGKMEYLKRSLFPERHGEEGNWLSEIYFFSRFRWNRLFKSTGWKKVKYFNNRLFYTGHSVLDSFLSIGARNKLSYLLGSSCHVYVLHRVKSTAPDSDTDIGAGAD
ncbi:MAG: class I SAM-dependent methyltransferase [bacterium]|nr:class I SAM-dependent methyltransferase [bacterium]